MKSFKNHLSFLIPLFILLFSIQFATMLDRGLEKYESKLTSDYSIVIVSQRQLTINELKLSAKNISSINEIDKTKYIQKLASSDISKSDLVYLKSSLPNFYTIKLEKLPTKVELDSLKKTLKKLNGIIKVETYKKAFEKLHQFLKLANTASIIFTIFIFVISILLIVKQMEIWTYAHTKRMYIMGLFGAPYWLKSAPLYKLVIIDSLIASLLVTLSFLYMPYITNLDAINKDLGLDLENFIIFFDTLNLLIISVIISVIAVTVTIFKDKK